MPNNPTRDHRLEWHLQHAKNCACREMPREIAEEVSKRRRRRKKTLSAYDMAKEAGIIGCVNAPSDLSTNTHYLSRFGKKK